MRTRRSAGFTLIELLVVIAIIGVLAAIAIPQFLSRQGKAYDARVIGDARNAANAEEAYFDDNGAYYTGPCDTLPGMNVSPGVSCNATAAGADFQIQVNHPNASRSCTWSSSGNPNLSCS
jgi:type IV pilus assembly protein PilA